MAKTKKAAKPLTRRSFALLMKEEDACEDAWNWFNGTVGWSAERTWKKCRNDEWKRWFRDRMGMYAPRMRPGSSGWACGMHDCTICYRSLSRKEQKEYKRKLKEFESFEALAPYFAKYVRKLKKKIEREAY